MFKITNICLWYAFCDKRRATSKRSKVKQKTAFRVFRFEKLSELRKGPFEEIIFCGERCALKERLNNYEAFNFKSPQVHASTAGD